ncbi:hypothetical protein [Ewingella americana]|uniref:Uncharacterized protein n=1 Tax=Ewingella americana TaxID=41202 RepID=A0A502G1L1_9GAMM|nr:hypothetical protein [Ewingella americana]TPG55420.1 hypothetical protein EAH77_23660 [Ewingella americana]
MNKIIFLLGFCISFNALASLDKYVGCFSSDTKKINVKFVSISDDNIPLSYVIYKNAQQPIPLIFSKKDEEEVGDGRPAEKTTTWLEVIDGKFNGQYIVMSQGARYYSFIYKNKNGKQVSLNENLDAYNDDHSDCIWR